MKLRKVVPSLLLAVIFACILALPSLAAPGDVVWEWSLADKQAFAPGGGEKGKDVPPWIKYSGNGYNEVVGTSVRFYDRISWYDGVDILCSQLDENSVYTWVIKVRSPEAQIFVLNRGAGSNYSDYLVSPSVTSYTFYLTTNDPGLASEFQFKGATGADRYVRINTENNGLDGNNTPGYTHPEFFVDSVVIYEGTRDDIPSTPSTGPGPGPTGDSAVLFIAIGALLLCGAGFVVFKKVKA
jgi:LPXTG-motif cell wall-anchored protein